MAMNYHRMRKIIYQSFQIIMNELFDSIFSQAFHGNEPFLVQR